MLITPASVEDREWAAALMAGTDPWITLGRGLEACQRVCRVLEDPLAVARDGSLRLGFVLYRPRGFAGSPYIASLAVDASARGQGVGRALIAFVEGQFPEARHLFLLVSAFNSRAKALYERVGFRPLGEIPSYILEGSGELIMHKRLQPSTS